MQVEPCSLTASAGVKLAVVGDAGAGRFLHQEGAGHGRTGRVVSPCRVPTPCPCVVCPRVVSRRMTADKALGLISMGSPRGAPGPTAARGLALAASSTRDGIGDSPVPRHCHPTRPADRAPTAHGIPLPRLARTRHNTTPSRHPAGVGRSSHPGSRGPLTPLLPAGTGSPTCPSPPPWCPPGPRKAYRGCLGRTGEQLRQFLNAISSGHCSPKTFSVPPGSGAMLWPAPGQE